MSLFVWETLTINSIGKNIVWKHLICVALKNAKDFLDHEDDKLRGT